MRLHLSGLLFLLVISLPSGNGLVGNDGVSVRSCTVVGGKCFFGCRQGWQWMMYCFSIFSCCKELQKEVKPPQAFEFD
ncbi:beta-defensin 136 [Pipistrellus kuhlii]|uniref:Defensin beta 136 n=1 Tax=Pipistrellus kuhlii TaxID=59472 RepID=A0A7J7XAT8_PIPKU|nr:beta-defensin 136 [Pipistrellus kuhlii]KAF6346410.1 defensin beta 136 [Pipistrellus kuhlii]